jgi:hypothetical protein
VCVLASLLHLPLLVTMHLLATLLLLLVVVCCSPWVVKLALVCPVVLLISS